MKQHAFVPMPLRGAGAWPRRFLLTAAALLAVLPAFASDPLPFDPATFDRSVDVCVDPYGYANNLWLRSTELPADRPMWGPRYAVIETNQRMQRELAEHSAAQLASGEARSDAALVGAFFASGMDQERIDAAGIAPLAADLRRIDAIDSREALLSYIADLSAQGIDLAFEYYVWARGDDPDRHVIYVEQGGRGLDDRERYLGDDDASKALRAAYRAHLAKLLQLAGVAADEAARQAEASFALEQALARASLSSVQLRDLGNLYAIRSLGEAQKISPHLGWRRFFAARGHASVNEVSLAQPEFFQELDRRLTDTSIADWRAYLRTRLLDIMAPYLATTFAEQHFAFHDRTVQGRASWRWSRICAPRFAHVSNAPSG